VFATAASLGGITTSNLGSDDQLVESCDPDGVTVTWDTEYFDPDNTTPGDSYFEVTEVDVAGLHADCGGSDMTVLLAGNTDTELIRLTKTTAQDAFDISNNAATIPASGHVPAEDVYSAHVLIDGQAIDTTTP
jgi:hypothetical protein